MKKLSVQDIIDFRQKSDKSKKKFATDLKKIKVKENAEDDKEEGGGNYWISGLSALRNAYKLNDVQTVKDKINELEEKFHKTELKRTKDMYQRNIDILYNYENFNFKTLQPIEKIEILRKEKSGTILTINDLKVQSTPDHVFTFKKGDVKHIGAISFIAKQGGLRKDELGIYAEMLHKYLNDNFSNDHIVDPNYCLAIDVISKNEIKYAQIQKGEIVGILIPIIDEIKQLM